MRYVLHQVPLLQLFALSACHAWSKGLEPEGENYEDREICRLVTLAKAARVD